jgi:hypothetical protein
MPLLGSCLVADFQYSFTVPDSGVDKQTWLVVWDYQVGLVRITPFFKALGYSKVCLAVVPSPDHTLTVRQDHPFQSHQRE